jgi:hypothetical protein
VFGAARRTRRKLARVLVVGAAHLWLAVAIIAGPVQAGARYFYCEAFGLSASDPCSAGAQSGHPCPFESLERQSLDCCSVITLSSIPEGASTEEHEVPPARIVAILAAGEYARSPSGSTAARGFAHGVQRWKRPPRPGGDLRTQLMVFLT